MDFTFSPQLHYLIHVVDDEYVAHCLDFDLVGSGASVEDAVCELNTAVRSFILFIVKMAEVVPTIKAAPQRYWAMFKEAEKQGNTQLHTLEISPELAPFLVNQCHFTYCLAMAA